jgi:hypothetical protein
VISVILTNQAMFNTSRFRLFAKGAGWHLNFRAFHGLVMTVAIAIATWFWMPPAWAMTQITLSDLSYKDCPAEFSEGLVTSDGSGRPANCFIITGTAKNPTNKMVYDADVYGRIYDANENNVLPNRTRVGKIDEVPPGESNFEVRISVPVNNPLPLSLKQFKASGFASSVRIEHF